MDAASIARLATQIGSPEEAVAAAVALLEGGASISFLARYRKEKTGGMDRSRLRTISEHLAELRELAHHRAAVLTAIEGQGKLTPELRQAIDSCESKCELDDIWFPFRPKRNARAAEAIEKGLEPLAEYLWNQEPDAWSLQEHIDVCVNAERGVPTREDVLRGAVEIIVEWIAGNREHRRMLREMIWKEGFLASKVVPAKAEQKTKYMMYYDRREPLTTIPSHRVLAIRRGSKEGILMSAIEADNAKALEYLRSQIIRDRESLFAPILGVAVHESFVRLLRPSLESDLRGRLKERADREAIRVFQDNLANLLLAPPAGKLTVLGLYPGNAKECTLAVVDENGNLLENSALSPAPPQPDAESARALLRDLIQKHRVQAIAMGTGAGSRDTESFVRQFVEEEKVADVLIAAVNDAGAAVYAASRIAREEFPNLDAGARAALTTARRLQDPLSELVKVDPKAIGVGQYQHDVDQKELHRRLVHTVRFCIDRVGVDPNTGHFAALRYVSGLDDRLARKIVAHRAANGSFPSRAALRTVPGLTEKDFEQAAGFLRVSSSENPLDRTAVHPESYPVVEQMAAALGVSTSELIGNFELISKLNLMDFVTESVGLPTLQDIRNELLKPGRDPRKTFAVPKFRSDVKDVGDLKEGMTLEGVVTNVTNFGAFVDIGVHQDGLVHLSQISNRFIRDPRETVRVGDVVQVKVLSIEVETKRIGLSMKALMPAVPRRRPKRRIRTRPAAAQSDPAKAATAAVAGGDGTAAVAFESRPQPRARRGRRPRRERAPRPGLPAPTAPDTTPSEPPEPELSLQEKIAMLQSKFRGIQ